jgi:hypothetical protein
MPPTGGGGGGGGLATVTTDGVTIQGAGTVPSPVALKAAQTDSSLQGAGTVASPLGILSVGKNATLTGAGTGASPLGVAGWPLTFFSSGVWNSNGNFGGSNVLAICGLVIVHQLTFGNIAVNVQTADAVNSYDIGIYTAAGSLVADIGPRTLPSTGYVHFATVQGSQTIAAGMYLFAWTGTTNTAKLTLQTQNQPWIYNGSFGSSTAAQLPSTIAAQTPAPAAGGLLYFVELY